MVTKILEHNEARKLPESVQACLDRHTARLISGPPAQTEDAPKAAIFSVEAFQQSLDKYERRDFAAYSRHCDRIWSRLPEPPERPRRVVREDLPQKERIADPEAIARAEGKRKAFFEQYPTDFENGLCCGRANVEGHPKGFHGWPLNARNAWFAGFNAGFSERGAS